MIYESEEELKLIREFCDMALKVGGIGNLETVNKVMKSIKPGGPIVVEQGLNPLAPASPNPLVN